MGSTSEGAESGKSPGLVPQTFPSAGMAALWAVFLYFNLQLVVLFASRGLLALWVEVAKQPVPEPQSIEAFRLRLWASVAALPFQWLLIWAVAGSRSFRLGSLPTLSRFLLGFVLVSGFCHALNWALTQLMSQSLGIPLPQHPLTRFGAEAVLFSDWMVLALSACLVAPVNEELFFRSILPRWFDLQQGPRMAALLGVAAGLLLSEINPKVGYLFPVCALIWQLFLWCLIEWNPQWSQSTRLNVALAGLFGAIHSFAWPTPIPLFFLALWLGHLAKTNQGWLAVALFHSLFNAIGVAALALGQR